MVECGSLDGRCGLSLGGEVWVLGLRSVDHWVVRCGSLGGGMRVTGWWWGVGHFVVGCGLLGCGSLGGGVQVTRW